MRLIPLKMRDTHARFRSGKCSGVLRCVQFYLVRQSPCVLPLACRPRVSLVGRTVDFPPIRSYSIRHAEWPQTLPATSCRPLNGGGTLIAVGTMNGAVGTIAAMAMGVIGTTALGSASRVARAIVARTNLRQRSRDTLAPRVAAVFPIKTPHDRFRHLPLRCPWP